MPWLPTRSRRPGATALALLAAAAGAAAGGCGGLETEFRGSRAVTPTPLTQAAIDRYPVAGPERALLRWCRDLQAGTAGANDRWPAAAAAVFRTASCPVIRDVVRRARGATAFTVLERRRIAPDGRVDTSVQAQAFHLVQRAGDWAVVEDALLSGAGAAPPARDSATARLPRLVGPADVTAQPRGSAVRAGLELLRALQYNDPLTATPAFGAAWRLTPRRLAGFLQRNDQTVRRWGVPRIASVRRRGAETLVVAEPGGGRMTFVFARGGEPRRWQLVRVRIGTLVLPDERVALGP